MLACDSSQGLDLDALREADHLEVARVDLQDGGRLWRDGAGVILGSRAVGGAHLDQARTREAHDVGHPESTTNLDQLTTPDDDLLAFGQGRQHQ